MIFPHTEKLQSSREDFNVNLYSNMTPEYDSINTVQQKHGKICVIL